MLANHLQLNQETVVLLFSAVSPDLVTSFLTGSPQATFSWSICSPSQCLCKCHHLRQYHHNFPNGTTCTAPSTNNPPDSMLLSFPFHQLFLFPHSSSSSSPSSSSSSPSSSSSFFSSLFFHYSKGPGESSSSVESPLGIICFKVGCTRIRKIDVKRMFAPII